MISDIPPGRLTLTVAEAASIVGCCTNSMYEAVRRGDFPSIRIGRRTFLPRAAFERIIGGGTPIDRAS